MLTRVKSGLFYILHGDKTERYVHSKTCRASAHEKHGLPGHSDKDVKFTLQLGLAG